MQEDTNDFCCLEHCSRHFKMSPQGISDPFLVSSSLISQAAEAPRKGEAQRTWPAQKIYLPLSKSELQQIRACQEMIELESTRALRHPVPTQESGKANNNEAMPFNPRSATGWQHSDPNMVIKMYEQSKQDLEKWLQVRAALLNVDLSTDHQLALDMHQAEGLNQDGHGPMPPMGGPGRTELHPR